MQLRIDAPNDKQRQFLESDKKIILYGGARGGGKSWTVRTQLLIYCYAYPGITCMIVRKTYPELRENHINTLCNQLGCGSRNAFAKYNDSKKTITFPNGSRILFRYCSNEADEGRFQGTEIDVLAIDEATQHPETRFKKLMACVRGINNYPKKIILTANPGGEGHNWVKRLFIDRNFEPSENPDDYEFIQALPQDNKVLMKMSPDYISQLEALPTAYRLAWLEGRWDIFVGQFFSDFRVTPDPIKCREHNIPIERAKTEGRFCHVIEPFDISQTNMKIYRAYDFGFNKPAALGYYAIAEDGTMYHFLEMYFWNGTANEGARWEPDRQFAEIARLEREHPWLKGKRIDGVADPAIWDGSRGVSIAEMAEKHGIYFDRGINDRIAGWMQCQYRLQFDENGRSMFYVFDNCVNFIRTIPLMVHSEIKPEDLDSSLEDHIADSWRYLCMRHLIKPKAPPPIKEFKYIIDPLDTLRRSNGVI